MGIVCCCETSQIPPPQIKIRDSQISENILNKDSSANLLKILTPSSIKKSFLEIPEALTLPFLKTPKAKLLDITLPLFKNNLKYYAKLTTQENSSNKIHNYLTEMEFPFTPEIAYLYLLNLGNKSFQQLDGSIGYYDVLNYTVSENMICLITISKTKKVFVVQPRTFIVVRVVRRNEDGSFEEYQKSIGYTSMIENDVVCRYLRNLEGKGEVGRVLFNGVKYEEIGGKWILKYVNQVDVKSGIGLKIIKGTLKKKMKKYNINLIKKLTEFLVMNENFEDLIWFSKDEVEIKNIFKKNFDILKKSKIDINSFGEDFVNSYNKKINEEKKIIVKSELVQIVQKEEYIEDPTKSKIRDILLSEINPKSQPSSNKKNIESIKEDVLEEEKGDMLKSTQISNDVNISGFNSGEKKNANN